MDTENLKARLERHHQESYGWARFCCRGDADEADNVLQAVYLKILDQRAVYGGKSDFRTWLFGVIRRTAAELRRRRLLEQILLVRLQRVRPVPSRVASADDALYQSETQTGLRRALAALPRRQAEVLQLVFYHDLSLAEAAAIMGVSLGSASTHYDRGKKKLRALLEGAGLQ
jgi:RNA polymerase sigma-70 factor (ECF subfamily)